MQFREQRFPSLTTDQHSLEKKVTVDLERTYRFLAHALRHTRSCQHDLVVETVRNMFKLLWPCLRFEFKGVETLPYALKRSMLLRTLVGIVALAVLLLFFALLWSSNALLPERRL